MSHQTFKVSIVIDEQIENFYVKHFIGEKTKNFLDFYKVINSPFFSPDKDEFQPIFNKFKSLVFQRNPSVNQPNLKVYWIGKKLALVYISEYFVIFRVDFERLFCVAAQKGHS